MKGIAALLAALLMAAPALAMDFPRGWEPPPIESIPNHRELWRGIIIELSTYTKKRNKDFIVVVRGGAELFVKGEREADWEQEIDPEGRNFEKRLPLRWVFRNFITMVDGLVMDGLYCGPYALPKPLAEMVKDRKTLDGQLDDERKRGIHRPPVPAPSGPYSIDPAEEMRKNVEWKRTLEREERQRRVVYAIDAMRDAGRPILAIDDCATQKEADQAAKNADRDKVLGHGGVGIAKLDRLPKGHARHENATPVSTITKAKNWLPMLNGDAFGTRPEWVMALEKSNHDILVIDVAHRGGDVLTKEEVKRLKYKELGTPRLVFAYMPMGKATDSRPYWQKSWVIGNPPFLFAADPGQPGSFITDMTHTKWKEMLGRYIAAIVDMGFDGVVLGDLDTYLWFEELMPLRN